MEVSSVDECFAALRDQVVVKLKFEGAEGAKHIAEALKHNTTLTILDLEWNKIGAEGAKHIAEALKQNKTLTTLDLQSNEIGAEGAKHIGEAFRQNTTLTTLNLQYNSFGAEGAKHVAEGLKHNTALSTFDLDRNNIGAEGAKHVAEGLKYNTALTILYLYENKIGDEGTKHIAAALKHNKTLTTLKLGKNEIGVEGAKHFAEAFKHNTTLTTLNFQCNNIGTQGAKHVAAALEHNKTLKFLDLLQNEIGHKGAMYIAEALKHNTALTNLNLGKNRIGAKGAVHIAEALKQNTTLTDLNLEENYIGREGATCIADAIKHNTALTYLDLAYNEFGTEGVEYVEEAVKESLALRWRLQKWLKSTTVTNTRKRKLSTEPFVDDLRAKTNAADCSVCMDPKDQLLLLPCLHPVCEQCLQDVKKMSLCVCRVYQEPFSADLVLPHHTATPNTAIYCSQHPDNNATKFCFDCKVLICIVCDHDASHQLYDLEEAMKKIKNDLPPILDDLLVQLGQVNEAIEYIEFARSAALNKLASIKSAIQLSFKALNNQQLVSQRDVLLEQAQAIANNQIKILDVQHEDLITAKDARETALTQARCLLAGGDITQLRVYRMVLVRIQLLLNNPLQLEPLVFDVLRYEGFDSSDERIGHVFEYELQLDIAIDEGNRGEGCDYDEYDEEEDEEE